MAAYFLHNGLRDFPFVQGLAALFGNGAQHLGVFGVFQHCAYRQRFAISTKEISAGNGIAGQKLFIGQQAVEARAHFEALISQPDSGLKQG